MADYPRGGGFRGRGRGGGNPGGRGGSFSGPRYGHGHHQNQGQGQQATEKPKRENILNLDLYMNKQLRVKFNGGREVTGFLKAHDQLMNLVLDDVEEILTDEQGQVRTRKLGFLVARGTLLTEISPVEGSKQIPNPFLETDGQ